MSLDPVTILEAALLGLVEGLTEFIPVSSTGHLILLGDLLGFSGPPGKVFEIVIQLGAILAVCLVYRQRLLSTLRGLTGDPLALRFVFNLALAFLPAAVVGVLAHRFIKEVLFDPYVVCAALVTGGIAILIVERMAHSDRVATVDDMRGRVALKIGLCQCLAMIPGVSRSGATILGARLLGVSRPAAAEFSFFLAIPTMFAATAYDVYKNADAFTGDGAVVIAVGFVIAFLAALAVVSRLVAFVSRHGFAPFGWYRIALGVVMFALLVSR